jgi:ABC-type multidrug transport system permease subunit
VIPGADGAVEYRLDPSRPESPLARFEVDQALQRAAGRQDPVPTRETEVSEPGSRYIDFLIPGIIGLNLMSGGMWGVGFNLVDMRMKKLLKRLLATPMRRSDFMAAQMVIRLAFMFIEVSVLLAFGRWVLGVPIAGSWPAIFLIGATGSLSFSGLALLLASRAMRIETVMGLMNAVTMPMMVCSGVFFSVERFPESVQPVIRALPLTALIDAMRSVVLEGAPLAAQSGRLALLALWGAAGFVVGLRLFRWN